MGRAPEVEGAVVSLKLVTELEVMRAYLRSAKTPLDKIRAAVHWAQQSGIRILHGDYGVIPSAEEWVVDEQRRPVGVSPLGAIVLAYQPDVTEDMPDPAAHVLGVSPAYAEGVADGFDRDLTGHFAGAVSRQHYLFGVEVGYMLRFDLTTRCERCSTSHLKADPCPLCEERGSNQGDLFQ
jgi:hypothetical protein